MKKVLYTSFVLLNILFISGCTKQSIDIEAIEKACRNFKIKTPSYARVSDPCSGGTTAAFDITFGFDDGDDCIHLIKNNPTFYNANNIEISNVTYSSELLKSASEVTVNSNSITYRFNITFANTTDASNFNHLVLKFNTENESGQESNELEIRLNTSCSVVTSGSYTVNSEAVTVPTAQTTFPVRLWDNAAEDGDIVSVYLNGTWIIENHTLLNAGTTFNISTTLLNSGANDLVVFALNEGSSGPNTVSISVNGEEIDSFNPGLLTGEAVRVNF